MNEELGRAHAGLDTGARKKENGQPNGGMGALPSVRSRQKFRSSRTNPKAQQKEVATRSRRAARIRPARMPYVGAGAPLHEQYVQRLPLHELWWRLLEPYKQPECPTHVMVTAAELPSFNATSGSFSDMKGNQTSRMGVYERTEHLEAPPGSPPSHSTKYSPTRGARASS